MASCIVCDVCNLESKQIKLTTLCKIKNDQELLEQFTDVFKEEYFKKLDEYEALFEKYWDFNMNKDNPYLWSLIGSKTYYWRCDKGHSWNEKVDTLISRKNKCRQCIEIEKEKLEKEKVNGKRKKNYKYKEMIERYWDYEKNGDIDPYEVSLASGPYYFRCDKNELHKWEKDFIGMCTAPLCPFCQGTTFCKENSIAEKYPDLVKYWNVEKNQGKEATEVLANNGRNYWWICEHGHEFIRTLFSMANSLEGKSEMCLFCKKKLTKYSVDF